MRQWFAQAGYRIVGRVVYAMSLHDAYDALDINPAAHFDLQQKYRDASRKNHPDLGGSTERMQEVNEAYEFLKKGSGFGMGGDSPVSRAEERAKRDAEYKRKLDLVDALWTKVFDAKKYTDYFKQWVTEPLIHKRETHLYRSDSLRHEHEWATHDRGTVFWLQMFVQGYEIQLKNMLGGGDPGMAFKYSTDNYLYHANRKQKMKQRTWDMQGHSHDVVNPEKLFPKATLKKVFAGKRDRKFMPRDFRDGLRRQVGADVDHDSAWIHLGTEGVYRLLLQRMTMFGTATWMANGIYEKYKRVWRPKPLSIHEDEEGLKDIVGMATASKRMKQDQHSMESLVTAMLHHIDTRQHKEAGK